MGIVTHLDSMVELLCKEEEERDPRDPGSMVRRQGCEIMRK